MEQELLSVLRDRSASTAEFRNASDRLARLLCAKTMSLLSGENPVEIDTAAPASAVESGQAPADILIVPVIRAAMALVPAFAKMLPHAPVGIVGIERDEETAQPKLYYTKLPGALSGRAVVLDPMLATGGTACLVAEMLVGHGYRRRDIYFTGVLAAPEGMNRLSELIPRSNIVVAAVDQGLDDRNFIVPGLGDYGDRYYGT